MYMTTENMISELRNLSEKHKNDTVHTFETNWSLLCHDVANELEALMKHYNSLYGDIVEVLGEERYKAAKKEILDSGNYGLNTALMIAIEKLRYEAGDFDFD